MMRFLAALLLLLMLPLPAAAAPLLKPAVTVREPVIRLGDIFDDVGERAQVAVATSPPPGSRMVLGSSWLAALADSQHIGWQPTSRFDQVVVERASREIGADEISQRLLDALADRTPVANAEIKLDTPAPRLSVAASDTGPLAVDGLTLDPRSGRFSAFVSVSATDDAGERARVSGRLIRMAEVPVPARLLATGETIGARDITTATLRADRVSADMLLQTSDLVGKSPRHSLRPGEPVRASDVEVPLVVHRGTLVTIVLETQALRLSAEGKAMDDGGMGAVIRVANTKSSRVIDAVVAGPGTVTVAAAP
ncbi:MAG TPA: flagellar basal body P-ring formation chaperone FlgA [Stellaceae bacterium]|nr:flagellar basal body P-ring formation chaperone FlgA [Stellaceae bacterium]